MNSAIKISGIKELNKALEDLNETIENAAGDSAMKSAEKIRDRIGQKAPLGPTGNLKRSPVARRYGNVAGAGIDRKIAPHAHLVEFGTSRTPAHPFFRPAIAESKNRVAKNFQEDISGEVRRKV
jgi:HK97 gp10 family phage protein